MHHQQVEFIQTVLGFYPQYRNNSDILDVGSADINGNNRQFFNMKTCKYTGIDIHRYDNVDLVVPAHAYDPKKKFDVVISGEMLEHDKYYKKSIKNMIRLVKKGGILIITCASEGREVHGTTEAHSWASPATNDYYHNISTEEFSTIAKPYKHFLEYDLIYNPESCDLYFYGIRK